MNMFLVGKQTLLNEQDNQLPAQHGATLNIISHTEQHPDLHANSVLRTHTPPLPSWRVLSEMPVNGSGSAAIPASLMVSCSLLA